MYHYTVIAGRLGRDPEMRYTPQGQQVTTLSVAVDDGYTDGAGQRVERTTWFRVSVWGKQAEACNQYLAKGRMVLVEGKVSARGYLDKSGQAAASLDMRASNVRFLDKADGGASAPAGAPAQDEAIPF